MVGAGGLACPVSLCSFAACLCVRRLSAFSRPISCVSSYFSPFFLFPSILLEILDVVAPLLRSLGKKLVRCAIGAFVPRKESTRPPSLHLLAVARRDMRAVRCAPPRPAPRDVVLGSPPLRDPGPQGDVVSFLLVRLIGRGLGLIASGIRQSVSWPGGGGAGGPAAGAAPFGGSFGAAAAAVGAASGGWGGGGAGPQWAWPAGGGGSSSWFPSGGGDQQQQEAAAWQQQQQQRQEGGPGPV